MMYDPFQVSAIFTAAIAAAFIAAVILGPLWGW
jgi:hypothetical protein